MTYIFQFNTKSDIIKKTSYEDYIPDKKQNLIIDESLYNTTYNNISNNNLCKTNIKNYTFYSTVGKQTNIEFDIFIFENNVINNLLLKSVNHTYIKPFVKYKVTSFVSNGIFSNIQSVYYEFNSDGDYTITCS